MNNKWWHIFNLRTTARKQTRSDLRVAKLRALFEKRSLLARRRPPGSIAASGVLSQAFGHVVVTTSTIGIYAKGEAATAPGGSLQVNGGWHWVAIGYFSLYVLTQVLRIREEFLREQKTKILLDALSRIETCSPEEFELIQIAIDRGILTFAQTQDAFIRLASSPRVEELGLNTCRGCRFWYGKNDIVCAVHPFGYESDSCTDFEPKP